MGTNGGAESSPGLHPFGARAVWNSVASADDEHPATFRDWEGGMLDAVRLRQVQSAIGRLNENQRAVIELAYFEGLSQTEMAEKMKQPLGTVKTWVRSALQTLRDELAVVAKA
jgi:RNA polymerase sigma-70 factor, ECF subfamily